METIRVLIADDHLIFREGLRAIMRDQSDITVVGEAISGEEAVSKTKELHPDIVLMDITMLGMNGLEATYQIKQHNPDISILVLTMHEGDEYFFKSLKAGASGYFTKGGSSRELISALHAIRHGDVYLYPSMAKKLLSNYLQQANTGQDKESFDGLTNREKEILKLVAEGHTNQDVAELLFISLNTVQTHRANIMAKLGLHNRTELIKYAIRRGLISLDIQSPE